MLRYGRSVRNREVFVAQPEKGLTMAKRVVLVTGSAGGIGSSIADRFDELGDTVVGLDLINGFDVTEPSACAIKAFRLVSPIRLAPNAEAN